jgi:hypothetical protein
MFDPLNLAKSASVRDMRRWRESEIVHGRVAMLAALGFIVGEQLEVSSRFCMCTCCHGCWPREGLSECMNQTSLKNCRMYYAMVSA